MHENSVYHFTLYYKITYLEERLSADSLVSCNAFCPCFSYLHSQYNPSVNHKNYMQIYTREVLNYSFIHIKVH